MQPKQILLALIAIVAAFVFLALPGSDDAPDGAGEGGGLIALVPGAGGTNILGKAPSLSDDPMSYRHSGLRGYRVDDAGIVGAGDVVWHRASVLADVPPRAQRDGALAGDVYTLPAPAECRFRARLPGERLVNINTEGTSGPESGVQAFDDAALIGATRGWIDASLSARGGAMAPVERHLLTPGLREVNLVLTDSSAPLYVVLQSMGGHILWNIHPAEGVRIAHIAVIGGGPVAVSPPPGDYDVEIANIRRTRCAPTPMKLPRDHWGFLSSSLAGANKDALRRAHESYQAYNAWFEPMFGQPAEQDEIGTSEQSFLLAGPTPAEGAPLPHYRPITDAIVLVSDEPYLLNAPAGDRQAFVGGLQTDLARQAFGGDFAQIIPAAMERQP